MVASSKTIWAQIGQPADPVSASLGRPPATGEGYATVATLKPICVTPPATRVRTDVPASLRHDMIERAAYLRAEQRGFAPGFEVDDWLAAEADVDSIIRERYR